MITKRIDAITKIRETHRGIVIPAPPSVKIELTARCDLRCSFCANTQKLRSKGDMDYAFLERILPELKASGVEEIGYFYLGESLLYPRLADAIKLAKDIGFEYVFLTTNGKALTQTKAYDIMIAGLDSLKISFNSFDREDFKKTTEVDAFDTIIKNIAGASYIRDKVLGVSGHRCGLYVSSIWQDKERNSRMQDVINKILPSIDEHYWLPLYNQAGYIDDKPTQAGNPGRIGALRKSLPCWVLFMEGHITWKGVLTGCSFSHEDIWDFGDLNDEGFMKAWNSKQAQELRRCNLNEMVVGSACEKCIKTGGYNG